MILLYSCVDVNLWARDTNKIHHTKTLWIHKIVCLYITIRHAVKFLLLFHYFHAIYCFKSYIQMPNCDEIHRFSLVQSYRASHLLQYQYYTEIAPQYMYKLNLTMMFSVHLFSSLQVIIQFWAKLHYIHVCDV